MVKKIIKINQKIYEEIVEEANCAILLLDSKGKIKFFNEYAKNLFDFRKEEILGCNVRGSIVLKEDTKFINSIKESFKTLSDDNLEYENTGKRGKKIRMLWNFSSLYEDKKKLDNIVCIGLLETKKRAFEELLSSKEKEEIVILERSRIARELHDTVNQTIYSTSLIAEILPKLWEKDEKEGRRRLEEIRQLTRGALTEMRMLLLELRPSTFAEEDLESLIKQLSRSIGIRTRIPVKVKVKGKYILSLKDRMALYRIAQEALNNIAKHSSATEANISLQYLHNRVNLIIEDNGCGFELDNALPDNLGLEIMKERANSLGASINIKSKPGIGTTISVCYKNN